MKNVFLLIFALSAFVHAQEPSEVTSAIARAGDYGSATVALVLAMYWLREANQRRVDDCQKYAADLKIHNEHLSKIIDKLMNVKHEE